MQLYQRMAAAMGSFVSYAEPYDPNTMHMFHFDTTPFTDTTGNPFTSTLAQSTSNKKFGAGSANSTGGRITVNNAPYVSGNFTMEGWFYQTANNSYQIYFSNGHEASGRINLLSTNTGRIVADLYGTGTLRDYGPTPTLNQWNHIAWVRNGNNLTLYVNGSQYGTALTRTGNYGQVGSSVYIGAASDNGAPFSGQIDEVRLSNNARYTANFTVQTAPFQAGPAPIIPAYVLIHGDGANNSTTITEASGKTLTVAGNTKIVTTQSKFGGSSIYFDGAGDYIILPATTGSNVGESGFGDWTMEGWFRFENLSKYPHCYQWSSSGTNIINVYVEPTGKINFLTGVNGTYTTYISSSNGRIATNTWYHIAVSRSGSTYRLFVDGALIGTNSSVNCPTGNLRLDLGGSIWNGNDWMWGYVDEFRMTKVAQYTAAFTPPGSAFP